MDQPGDSVIRPLDGTPIWLTSMPQQGWRGFRAIFESPTEGGVVTVNKYWRQISQGEPIWVWQSGKEAGIVAAGVTCGDPYITIPYEGYELKDDYGFKVYVGGEDITEREGLRHYIWVPIDAVKVFDQPIPKAAILDSEGGDAFAELTIIRAPMGSMHKVTPEADLVIRNLLSAEDQPWPPVPLPSLEII